MKHIVMAIIGLIVLAGCQTAPTGPMPTNTFTFNADRQTTKEAIVSVYMQRGYQIVRDSNLQLVLDRPANDSFGAQLLYGSQWNGVPNARVTLTFLGDRPTSVTSQIAVVTNPGTAFERVNDLSNNYEGRQQIETSMIMAKAVAEGTPTHSGPSNAGQFPSAPKKT